jgi:CDP-diacylglycerol--glycerol-3-phosphate 3-phosphatidyltransferase
VGDLLFVAALWLAGASAAVCSGGALLMLCHEAVRMRRRVTGRRDVGVVTVSERPTRVIVTAAFLLAAGLYDDPLWSSLGAWAWLGLGAVGLAQLLLVSRTGDR